MKKLPIIITLCLCIIANWTYAKIASPQRSYISYTTSKNSTRGMQRAPARYTHLPLTWIEEERLHFRWLTDETNVCIYIIDNNNQIVSYNIENEINGNETLIDVSYLEKKTYTLLLIINGVSYIGTFVL